VAAARADLAIVLSSPVLFGSVAIPTPKVESRDPAHFVLVKFGFDEARVVGEGVRAWRTSRLEEGPAIGWPTLP
jgi:hypothetical protein